MNYLTYPLYKQSEIGWYKEIPKEWDVKPLLAVVRESTDSNKEMIESNLLSLSYGRIIQKDINSSEGLLPESFETYQIVEPNDIVMRLTDLQNDKRSLRSAIVRDRGIITSAYLALRPHSIDPNYLNYLLRSYDLTKVFYSMGGGLRQSLNYLDVKRLPIIIPSLAEQKAIVTFLDHEITKIDNLILEQEKLVQLMKERLDTLVLNSFEAKDTSFNRLVHAVDVIERPVIQQEGEMYEPLGLFNRGRGLFHKELRAKSEMGDSDFFWIEEGDLIISGQFAWEGSVALAYPEENGCVVSHRYPVLRGKSETVLTEYLFAIFTTSHGEFLLNECSVGAAGRNRPLNLNSLLKEVIPIPNLQTQRKIAELVLERRNLIQEINLQSSLVNDRRAAIVLAAVTGEIDVRNYTLKEAA